MPKKTPIRRCVGCMQMIPKTELVRIVKSKDGEISLDLTGKKDGRGAYICRNNECFEKARRAKRFEREFACEIPEDVYANMEAELRNGK